MSKRRSAVPFISSRDSNLDVDLSRIRDQGSYSYWDYAQGYFVAAEHVASAMRENYPPLPLEVYPLLFLYRHAIELSLKHFGKHMQLAIGRITRYKQTHFLLDVWKVVRPCIKHLPHPGNDPKLIKFANCILTQFCRIDPTGEESRYPYSKRGDLHLKSTDAVNVGSLTLSMNRLRRCFEIWYKPTEDFIEAKIQRGIDELEQELELDDMLDR